MSPSKKAVPVAPGSSGIRCVGSVGFFRSFGPNPLSSKSNLTTHNGGNSPGTQKQGFEQTIFLFDQSKNPVSKKTDQLHRIKISGSELNFSFYTNKNDLRYWGHLLTCLQ